MLGRPYALRAVDAVEATIGHVDTSKRPVTEHEPREKLSAHAPVRTRNRAVDVSWGAPLQLTAWAPAPRTRRTGPGF